MGKSSMSCFSTDGTAMQTYQFSRRCVTLWLQTVGRRATRSRHKHAQINTVYNISVPLRSFLPLSPQSYPFFLSFLSSLSLSFVSRLRFFLPFTPSPLSSLLLLFPPLSFTDCQQTSRQQADKRWGRHKHAQMNAVNRRTTSAWWRHRCRHEFVSVHNVVPTTLHTFLPSSRPICTSSASPSFLYNRLLRIYV